MDQLLKLLEQNAKLTTEQLVNKVNAKYLELKTIEEARVAKLNKRHSGTINRNTKR